jgi:hypothetical protein
MAVPAWCSFQESSQLCIQTMQHSCKSVAVVPGPPPACALCAEIHACSALASGFRSSRQRAHPTPAQSAARSPPPSTITARTKHTTNATSTRKTHRPPLAIPSPPHLLTEPCAASTSPRRRSLPRFVPKRLPQSNTNTLTDALRLPLQGRPFVHRQQKGQAQPLPAWLRLRKRGCWEASSAS